MFHRNSETKAQAVDVFSGDDSIDELTRLVNSQKAQQQQQAIPVQAAEVKEPEKQTVKPKPTKKQPQPAAQDSEEEKPELGIRISFLILVLMVNLLIISSLYVGQVVAKNPNSGFLIGWYRISGCSGLSLGLAATFWGSRKWKEPAYQSAVALAVSPSLFDLITWLMGLLFKLL